ncbi:MAG: hypothetical protein KGL48_06890 [Sphingomonadales bacterium]|nr:hypothetical protein [Sphingomonadales bacterium]MDE2569935.1 hypothetical protein [Sphingomonadales bacterium]
MRRSLSLAAMVLATASATALAPCARASDAAAAFAPPSGPMRLTRMVIRPLGDGEAIVATRSYRVAFVAMPGGGGWRIDGVLVETTIDAPPRLAALAGIERKRRDDAMFPMRLATDGTIKEAADLGPRDRAAIDAAVEAARRQLKTPAPGDLAFLAQIRAAAAGSATARWPEALFLPGPLSQRTERTFALPGGGEGTVLIAFTRSGCCGTMQRAERKVTTRMGGMDQDAIERWTLEPEGG